MEACKFSCVCGCGGSISVILKPPKLSLRWGLGVTKLDIHNHNVYAYSFILSTKTFLRTFCSPRCCAKKLKFLIPLFFGTPCRLWIVHEVILYSHIHLLYTLYVYCESYSTIKSEFGILSVRLGTSFKKHCKKIFSDRKDAKKY